MFISGPSPSTQLAPLISHANRSFLRAGGNEHQLVTPYSLQLDGSLITVLRIQPWRHVSKKFCPGQILLSPPLSPKGKGRQKIGVTGSQFLLLQADSKAQSFLQSVGASFPQGLGCPRELSFPWLTLLSSWKAALRAGCRS